MSEPGGNGSTEGMLNDTEGIAFYFSGVVIALWLCLGGRVSLSFRDNAKISTD